MPEYLVMLYIIIVVLSGLFMLACSKIEKLEKAMREQAQLSRCQACHITAGYPKAKAFKRSAK